MRKLQYVFSKARNVFLCGIRKIKGHRKFKRKRYYGKRIKDIEETNALIGAKIQSGQPFLVARFGDAELRALMYGLENKLHLRKGYPDYIRRVMHNNAGFYPTDNDSLDHFTDVLIESCSKVDIFAVWFNLMEDYVIHEFDSEAELSYLEAIEPYRSKNPWSRYLKGKKVLVVHPFALSIQKQYEKRINLFEDKNVLPEFTLITYKAIQTNAGGESAFESWFDALDHMFKDISKIDFDIAIVGCGAYGLPLSAKIKGLGKQVVHLAGATQILFGIRGARWDVRPEMQHYFNENWTRPLESEKPKDAKSVENGCYW